VSGSAPQVRTDIELFLEELGLLPTDAIPGAKQRRESLAFLFARLCEDAAAIQPELRPPAHDPHPLGDITHSDRP
jgi:hypothetical protein